MDKIATLCILPMFEDSWNFPERNGEYYLRDKSKKTFTPREIYTKLFSKREFYSLWNEKSLQHYVLRWSEYTGTTSLILWRKEACNNVIFG